MNDAAITAVASKFGGRKLAVVGDIMLDRYRWGDVDRISPEAPVPVVRILRATENAGGAGNVARNLSSLGLSVGLAGIVGSDSEGVTVRTLLGEDGVDISGVLAVDDRPTILKERIMGGRQQIVRLDHEATGYISDDSENRLIDAGRALVSGGASALILSDYNKGTLTEDACAQLIAEARKTGIPVIVDPKGADFTKYSGATAITPNRAELALAVGDPDLDGPALLAAGEQVRHDLNLQFVVVTLGAQGMELIADGASEHIPAHALEVFDVSGAGDTVVACLAAGLAAGLKPSEALSVAAVAAGLVVRKVGTAVTTTEEVLRTGTLDQPPGGAAKIVNWDEAASMVDSWHRAGDQVVFTNGCFDLLHPGHVTLIEHARTEGQRLIVAVNSDASTQRLKGPERPIVGQADRARVISALGSVDAVVIFDEDTPLELIQALRPDVVVKGTDYTEDEVVGGNEVKSWGGRVVLVPLEEGHSTTGLFRRISDQ